jgi:hypothetical protein
LVSLNLTALTHKKETIMENNLSRRHAVIGAISLAAAAMPRIAKAQPFANDLPELKRLIARWQMMDEALNIEGKACSALEDLCQHGSPPPGEEVAHAAHWERFNTRQKAWEAQINVVDTTLQDVITFPVTSPEALRQKAAFIGSCNWFEQGFDYETVHDAAAALIDDIQRVAFGEA